ncbi:MAG TPA: zinc-ribbon domain-containing protein, partial [Methanocella sp.]|nr:zinc-ribbon domain-containing protein [Methanocella sp.]
CTNCGAEAPEGAGFCPKCGSGIGPIKKLDAGRRIKPGISVEAWEFYRSPEHKMLKATMGGLVILMLGTLIFIAATGISSWITWANFFAYFLAGWGVLMVVNFLIHLLAPGCRFYRFGDLVGGTILLAIGGLCIAGFGDYFWPLAIVSVGLYIISMGILKFYSGNGHSA